MSDPAGLTPVSVTELANTARTYYRADSTRAESLIESYLETQLAGLSPAEQQIMLEQLRLNFARPQNDLAGGGRGGPSAALTRLFSLILGEHLGDVDLGTEEIVQRLADSLNSVFDQLNELVGLINTTFGTESPGLETIRFLIGSDLGGPSPSASLAEYLGQIKQAFLIANQAARQAALHEVGLILAELDPDRLTGDTEKGLRFGFLRRGDFLEAYREKYGQIRKWFETNHFLDDFAREFERVCQRLHSETGGTL